MDTLNDLVRQLEAAVKVLSGNARVTAPIVDLITTLRSECVTLPDQDNSELEVLRTHRLLLLDHLPRISDCVRLLVEEVDKLKEGNETMKKTMMEEISRLTREVRQLTGRCAGFQTMIDPLKLVIGQVAFEVEKVIVGKVLAAGNTSSKESYVNTIQQMEEVINSGPGDVFTEEVYRDRAEKEWKALKETLPWTGQHSRYLKKLKEKRLSSAHPPINLDTLRKQLAEGELTHVVENKQFFSQFLTILKRK